MNYPFQLHIGGVNLPVHLIFEILAYTIAYQYYAWLRRRSHDRISDEHRLWIFIGAAAGAFLGSHGVGVLEKPDTSPLNFIDFMANKTIAGGLIGGLFGVELTKKILGVTASSGDLMTFPLILGMCLGRVGCHLEGLKDGTFGLPSSMPWAINFGDGIPRHPVNLYDILFLSILAGSLWILERRRALPDGWRFRIFMIAYMVYRIGSEYLKPAYYWPGLHLSTIQIACLLCLVYYAWIGRKRVFR